MNAWNVGQVLLWLLVLCNFLLTLALIRRVTGISQQLGPISGSGLVEGGLEKGDPAPDFEAETVGGARLSRADVSGQPLAIAFFSTTCAACIDSLPIFSDVGRRARTAGARAVAVIDAGPLEAQPFIQALESDTTVLLAPRESNTLLQDYRVEAYPSYTAVDADGTIAGSFMQPSELRLWLEEVRSARP